MDCRDAQRFAQLRLDEEIEPLDCAQLDSHLSACNACRGRHEAEHKFHLKLRGQLRAQADAKRSPPALEARIAEELSRAAVDARSPLTRWGVTATAALMLLGISWSATRDGPDVFAETVKRHSSNLPPEVRSVSGPAEVDQFLRDHLRFPVSAPRLDESGMPVRLVGARLSSIHDRDVALMMYDHRGAKLSLFAYPIGSQGPSSTPPGFERREVGGRVLYVGAERGYNVVAWERNEMLYSLVSDVDTGELVQLASAVR